VPTLEDRCPQQAPLLYAVGPWEIPISSAAGSLSEKTAVETYINMQPGPYASS
jgi:hypothetical protein